MRADPELKLSDFLAGRASGGDYATYRGILARVSDDLQQLSGRLREAYDDWSRSGSARQPPLQRIVLYIDDLDRCAPTRVVETLQALYLLLAEPLFLVVVAVDPQWLLRCLDQHHRQLFPGSPSSDDQHLDYLDKIFQIPYALRPMEDQASAYLRALVEPLNRRSADKLPPAAGTASSTPASGSTSPAPEPATSAAALADPPPYPPAGPELEAHVEPPTFRQLELRTAEVDFISRLAPLLPTPRAGKKLVNLYRLVRNGIDDGALVAFLGDPVRGGPYQAVLVLLAIVVGRPGSGAVVLAAIGQPRVDANDIVELIRGAATTAPVEQREAIGAIADAVAAPGAGRGDGRSGGPTVAADARPTSQSRPASPAVGETPQADPHRRS